MVQNKALILAQHPTGYPIPGTDLVIQTSEIDLSSPPPEGGLILKINHLSYDPYMRGRMKPPNPGSYITGYALGSPLINFSISTVVASSNPRFVAGEVVLGTSEFKEYVVVDKKTADQSFGPAWGGYSKLENPLELDEKLFLGALGMSGLTAYSSLYEIGKPKKDQVIFISAASGAVGQIVGQLAKREGLKVLGSVGSEEKLKFVKEELGFDGAFNYKTEAPADGIKRLLKGIGKEGLDIYYDNVGGEHLDASILAMNTHGTIIACGSISQSSKKAEETHGIANMPFVVGKRLTIRGFLVTDADMGPKYYDEWQKNVQKWIKDGSLVVKMSITKGIDNAAEGFVGMLKGENFGKAVLTISEL